MKDLEQLNKRMNTAMTAELTDDEFDEIICKNLKSLKGKNPVAYNEIEAEAEANRQEKLPFVEA
ncbi:MAG: hypothetical protein J6T10_10675 [Methanobrevibacter sp.]|nr:hypothetical protein [Methanobrevibacter sp.]